MANNKQKDVAKKRVYSQKGGATAGKASPTGASPRVRQAVTNNADMGRVVRNLVAVLSQQELCMDPREAT